MIVNVLANQVGWFACVYGAALGHPWPGTLFALVFVGVHVALAQRPRTELALVLAVGVIGTAWDSAVMASGLLRYHSGVLLPFLAPAWISALWLLFATALNVSLRWMRGRAWAAILFGLIGSPLSWYAGARIGAAEFESTARALLLQGLGWAVLTPLLVRLAVRLDGRAPAVQAATAGGPDA